MDSVDWILDLWTQPLYSGQGLGGSFKKSNYQKAARIYQCIHFMFIYSYVCYAEYLLHQSERYDVKRSRVPEVAVGGFDFDFCLLFSLSEAEVWSEEGVDAMPFCSTRGVSLGQEGVSLGQEGVVLGWRPCDKGAKRSDEFESCSGGIFNH